MSCIFLRSIFKISLKIISTFANAFFLSTTSVSVNASPLPCNDIYRGPWAASEVETQHMAQFLLSNSDVIQAYVSLHAYTQNWLSRWSYTTQQTPDDNEELVRKIDILLFIFFCHFNFNPHRSKSSLIISWNNTGFYINWAIFNFGWNKNPNLSLNKIHPKMAACGSFMSWYVKLLYTCTLERKYFCFYPRPVLVLSLHAFVDPSVRPPVRVRQPRACPPHNSSPVQTRITKFGPEV